MRDVTMWTPLAPRITDAVRKAHRAFVATLGDKLIWNDFWEPPETL